MHRRCTVFTCVISLAYALGCSAENTDQAADDCPSCDDPSEGGAGGSASVSSGGLGGEAVGGAGGQGGDIPPDPNCLPPILSDSALDVDLVTHIVDGTITNEGAPIGDSPFGESIGRLTFFRPGREQGTHILGSTGPATYALELFPATYLANYSSGHDPPSWLPTSSTLRAEDALVVDAPLTFDFDVTVVDVPGTVTVNGQPLIEDPGGITLRDKFSKSTTHISLSGPTPGDFVVRAFASTYDVEIHTTENQTVLPRDTSHVVMTDVTLQAGSTLEIDLTTIDVAGTMTENGAMIGDASFNRERGTIEFVDSTTGDAVVANMGETGAVTFQEKLFPSTYDIVVRTEDDVDQYVLPAETTHIAASGVSLMASQTYDIDLKTVNLTGLITENGGPLTESTLYNRGYIEFVDTQTGDSVDQALGAASQTDTLLEELFVGTYNIYVRTEDSDTQDALPASARHLIATSVTVDESNATRDIDLKTVTLDSVVTKNGIQLPNNASAQNSRGRLMLMDATSGHATPIDLGGSGPAELSAKLFASTYDVFIDTNETNTNVLPEDSWFRVAKDLVLLSSASHDFDLETVRVTYTVTKNGAPLPDNGLGFRQRGWLWFVHPDAGPTTTMYLGATGPAVGDIEIFAGSYDISVDTHTHAYQDALPATAYHKVLTGCAP